MKSKTSHAVLDFKSRKEKASAIIKILKNYKDIKNCKMLDIGTGSGVIASELGNISKSVYSIDIIDERISKNNFVFKKVKNEKLPFKDNEFDIVISNHVMSHVKNDKMHLMEIRRILKEDGIVYLSMLNRIWPLEPNFNLLFLSWLPKKLADSYVRFCRKGYYYNVNPLTYFKFTKKIRKFFTYEDVTIRIIRNKRVMPTMIYSALKIFSPVWIFILRKR